ncbi:MAG: hypothetical protein K2L54_03315, partial [Clostridiales bacterium]|nr:hypothetical protein [Clostridiales bacterium]
IVDNGSSDIDGKEEFIMYAYINGNRLTVDLVDNSSSRELLRILGEGDIEYTADDYGGFEKVGNIGVDLPRNDVALRVGVGDVILYQGSNICFYYGNNSWTFTRLGRIDGYSEAELRVLLGAGDGALRVRLSLK